MSVVLVTGGAGYVGSHVVMALAAAGYDAVVYDNLSAGHAGTVDVVAAQFPSRSIQLIRGDVCDAAAVSRALESSRASAVVHLAARLSVGESVRDPIGYYRTNVVGSLTVLEAMAARGVQRFVLSSTAATFGEPASTPIAESHPQQPVNPYGQTKLAVERALPHVERAHGIRWMALRYFNAAGAHPSGLIGEAHDPEEHLIPLAIRAAHGGGELTVFGTDYPTPDGTCIRDFVHVSDLADAHVGALRALEASGASTAYNLGSGRGTSIRDVLAAVERVTGRPVPHRFGPRRPGDPARLVASSELIRRELGWAPALGDVDTIIRTAWEWHRREWTSGATGARAAGRG
jgi:UDP-glucose-4-epimerase GalE